MDASSLMPMAAMRGKFIYGPLPNDDEFDIDGEPANCMSVTASQITALCSSRSQFKMLLNSCDSRSSINYCMAYFISYSHDTVLLHAYVRIRVHDVDIT